MSGAVLHRPGQGRADRRQALAAGPLTPAEIGAIASRHDFRAV
jgi:hypothetical protein